MNSPTCYLPPNTPSGFQHHIPPDHPTTLDVCHHLFQQNILTEKEAWWYEGARYVIITGRFADMIPQGYMPHDAWPRIEKIYPTTIKAFIVECRAITLGMMPGPIIPQIVPIPIAADEPFALLEKALEDVGNSSHACLSAYAVLKHPSLHNNVNFNIFEINRNAPCPLECAHTIGLALKILAANLTAACLFSGPNEQCGILEYLINENSWCSLMHLLTYFSCQHFFTKHQDEYNNPLNLAEKASLIATVHHDDDRWKMRLMAPNYVKEWYNPHAEQIYHHGLRPNLSHLFACCHLAINEVTMWHPYNILPAPPCTPDTFTPYVQDETGTLYQRTCHNYELWQHYAATEESIQGIQGNAHAAAHLKAYKVRNQLIVNINMKNVLKENTHTGVRKQNQQTSKWSPQSRPSICPFPILTYYLRVTIYGMNRKPQRLQK